MPIEKVKLEFSEKDLKDLITEKYELKPESVVLRISHYEGDSRDPSYTTVTVEGQKKEHNSSIPYQTLTGAFKPH